MNCSLLSRRGGPGGGFRGARLNVTHHVYYSIICVALNWRNSSGLTVRLATVISINHINDETVFH
jgi:hypothetical protein